MFRRDPGRWLYRSLWRIFSPIRSRWPSHNACGSVPLRLPRVEITNCFDFMKQRGRSTARTGHVREIEAVVAIRENNYLRRSFYPGGEITPESLRAQRNRTSCVPNLLNGLNRLNVSNPIHHPAYSPT
jgi:hypothetical protein